eukprot:TRINITY_DN19782_c0_g1_i1.p1 TRINITY_DN19782_c0_g1~~TRINITY_DN19782_c0_g1_i1.p1  ORF type:complete len:420 (+),score=154.59 TRINITY_DN19782_c0_g1_i1:61-1320(+)
MMSASPHKPTSTKCVSPSYNGDGSQPRGIRAYEQQAHINAVRRALATAKTVTDPKEAQHLEKYLGQLEASKNSSSHSEYYSKMTAKWSAREQALEQRDEDLHKTLLTDDKKRETLLREHRRARTEEIVERQERYQKRTEDSDVRVREMAQQRAKKLAEVSKKRHERLTEIETKKHEKMQEQLASRKVQQRIREKKVAVIREQQEEKEEKLELEMCEKKRTADARKMEVERRRLERVELVQRQRREVATRSEDINDNEKKQQELEATIEARNKRVNAARKLLEESLRERKQTYDDKINRKEAKLMQESTDKARRVLQAEKKRQEKEKRAEDHLRHMRSEFQENVNRRQQRRQLQVEAAQEKIAANTQEKGSKVIMKECEVADKILGRLENMSSNSVRFPLISPHYSALASQAGSPASVHA